MFITRWQIDARFGHKDKVIELLRNWDRDIGSQAGLQNNIQYLSGSIGAREATVENNVTVTSLAELEAGFAAIGQSDAHKKWGEALEPHVVSGTSHWQILRVL